jgi:hypothetical protein
MYLYLCLSLYCMTLLIFSCNRALQLQTLLDSLTTYLTIDGPLAVHVLYAASDEAYEAGYRQVRQRFPGVSFHRERQQRTWAWPQPFSYWKNTYRYVRHAGLRKSSDFKVLTESILTQSPHEAVMFLTDDSLFTRPIRLDAARMQTVLDNPGSTFDLSLRHGLTLQPRPTDVQPHPKNGYVWRVRPDQTNLGDWTWRFSVDGHLYPRRALLPILRRLHYANPNSLEGFVNEYVRHVRPQLFSQLLFDAEPSLVGFILNKVQTHNGNRSFDVSPTYLNQKLLNGFALTYLYNTPATAFQPVLNGVLLRRSSEEELLFVTP